MYYNTSIVYEMTCTNDTDDYSSRRWKLYRNKISLN